VQVESISLAGVSGFPGAKLIAYDFLVCYFGGYVKRNRDPYANLLMHIERAGLRFRLVRAFAFHRHTYASNRNIPKCYNRRQRDASLNACELMDYLRATSHCHIPPFVIK
jgi:hypothetical protein